jgi:hypothetical protein
MDTYIALLLVLLALAAAAVALTRSRGGKAQRKKPSVGGFAWALMFLSSGRMPPPPPQSQIEQEAGERKNREIGRGGENQ